MDRWSVQSGHAAGLALEAVLQQLAEGHLRRDVVAIAAQEEQRRPQRPLHVGAVVEGPVKQPREVPARVGPRRSTRGCGSIIHPLGLPCTSGLLANSATSSGVSRAVAVTFRAQSACDDQSSETCPVEVISIMSSASFPRTGSVCRITW